MTLLESSLQELKYQVSQVSADAIYNMCVHTYICIYVCVVCVYMCIYIHIYIYASGLHPKSYAQLEGSCFHLGF